MESGMQILNSKKSDEKYKAVRYHLRLESYLGHSKTEVNYSLIINFRFPSFIMSEWIRIKSVSNMNTVNEIIKC